MLPANLVFQPNGSLQSPSHVTHTLGNTDNLTFTIVGQALGLLEGAREGGVNDETHYPDWISPEAPESVKKATFKAFHEAPKPLKDAVALASSHPEDGVFFEYRNNRWLVHFPGSHSNIFESWKFVHAHPPKSADGARNGIKKVHVKNHHHDLGEQYLFTKDGAELYVHTLRKEGIDLAQIPGLDTLRKIGTRLPTYLGIQLTAWSHTDDTLDHNGMDNFSDFWLKRGHMEIDRNSVWAGGSKSSGNMWRSILLRDVPRVSKK